jgi:hypothetical protein
MFHALYPLVTCLLARSFIQTGLQLGLCQKISPPTDHAAHYHILGLSASNIPQLLSAGSLRKTT